MTTAREPLREPRLAFQRDSTARVTRCRLAQTCLEIARVIERLAARARALECVRVRVRVRVLAQRSARVAATGAGQEAACRDRCSAFQQRRCARGRAARRAGSLPASLLGWRARRGARAGAMTVVLMMMVAMMMMM
eukprot:6201432-Pleurochrysis_carterae.AAC.2